MGRPPAPPVSSCWSFQISWTRNSSCAGVLGVEAARVQRATTEGQHLLVGPAPAREQPHPHGLIGGREVHLGVHGAVEPQARVFALLDGVEGHPDHLVRGFRAVRPEPPALGQRAPGQAVVVAEALPGLGRHVFGPAMAPGIVRIPRVLEPREVVLDPRIDPGRAFYCRRRTGAGAAHERDARPVHELPREDHVVVRSVAAVRERLFEPTGAPA